MKCDYKIEPRYPLIKGVMDNCGVFINTPEDMQWLREVHIPHFVGESAIIVGNEDCPEYISIYPTSDPDIYDIPQIWVRKED